MSRILELLAIGLGALSADELTELAALLAPANEQGEFPEGSVLGQLTDDELTEVDAALVAAADPILDLEGRASDAEIAGLEVVAAALTNTHAEGDRREAEREEDRTHRAELARRIRGEAEGEEEGEGEGDPAAEGAAEGEGEGGEPPAEGEPAEGEREPVTAGAGAPARRAPVTRPAHTQPRAIPIPRHAPIVASANVPGITGGTALRTEDDWVRAIIAAADVVASASMPMSSPVLHSQMQWPAERILDSRNTELNEERIRAVTAPQAITAAGGICAPVPYSYDLPTVGDNSRPVRDALARFGVQRGGIRLFTPPTIADVTGAIGTWTEANDQAPSSPTTKPFLTVLCNNTDAVTLIYAITQQLKIGNFKDRWYPELIAAYLKLVGVYQARYADAKLLAAIAAGSKTVTYNNGGTTPNIGSILGTSKDVFTGLRQLFAGIRYRHRIGRDQRFHVIGFEWVRDNMITDLVRTYTGSGVTPQEAMGMALADLDAFFTEVGANITWSPDYQFGIAGGSPGGPFTGAQNTATPINGYPAIARFYVYPEGNWLHLDGGTLDLGVFRDQTLVGTNDMMMFSETFENAAYHGVPGESYNVDVHICASGQSVNPAGAIVCTTT